MAELIETKLQVTSEDWLKVHGLSANGLTLDEILPSIGFLQSNGEVSSIGRTVSSQYGDGMFVRQENSSGQIYNICGSSMRQLASIEEELVEAVAFLKARYDWMVSKSRLKFGVVCGRRIVMVIDYYGTEHAQFKSLTDIAVSVLREQLIHVDQFNIISCSSGVSSWRESLVSVSDDSIEEAVAWVRQNTLQTPPLTSNIVQALSLALEHTEADNIYLLSYGNSSLRAFEQLLERVKPSLIPVNVSAFNCDREEKLDQYKLLATASKGRCHCYTPPPPKTRSNPLSQASFSSITSSVSSRRSGSAQSQTSRPSSATKSSLPSGLTDEDTVAIWEELGTARDTLAQIQALRIEMGDTTSYSSPEPPKLSDHSMTSEQWLGEYGLKAKKLMFEDLVRSLAFRHCNGTVRTPLPPKHKRTDKIEMVTHTKVVHAQYCKEFVHMRWPEGRVIHIQLSKHAHRVFCEGVEGVVGACRQRLSWLKEGSRELFGTLLESKIVIVVDTSVSMANRLSMLKEKLQQLIQEQLSTKDQFTVFHFNSKVYPWRENLVASSPQTLAAVSQWVDSLVTEGSTNTQAALVQAMTVRGAEAVYLMTDGRPDTKTDVLLAKIQQLPRIPVHTISFNCADSKANHFLAQLASNTNGRYHYLSEDVSDPEGPKAYQSEDITRLEEEIKRGFEQLERANQLLSECQLTKRRRGMDKKKKTAEILKKSEDSDADSGESGSTKPLISSKKWLAKNSLSSLRLTLMDALGPASIPHTSKRVPLLQKDVHSKVFSQSFPLAHVSNSNRMTLIHPNGVDLMGYEKRLEEQVVKYQARLSKLAWAALPTDRRAAVLEECGLEENQSPSYSEHRTALRRVLDELDWPRPQLDFDLIEEEIQQAETYRQYSQSLREEAKKVPQDGHSVTSGGSHIPLMDHPLTSVLKKGRSSKPSKSAKVIVRSKVDGFYYPGVVTSELSSKSISVRLADDQEISSHSSLVIPLGGARPCPVLRCGDHALVRVRASSNGRHPGPSGQCDYYIPGLVQVLPANERKGHALHSVLVFNGRVVTCDRRGIVKITTKRYTDTCKFIRQKVANGTEATESDTEGAESHSDISYSYSSSVRMPTPPDSERESEASSNTRESVRSNASSAHKPVSEVLDLSSLIETQRAQEELILQYRKELSAVQEKQKALEEQVATNLNKDFNQSNTVDQPRSGSIVQEAHAQKDCDKNRDELGDFPDDSVEREEVASQVPLPADADEPHPPVLHSEAGVNTDVMTEDKGVETGPITESVAVGTEWSLSESESSDEVDVGTDADRSNAGGNDLTESPIEEELSVQHTPVSTPIPTPPLSRVSTPNTVRRVTPIPSEHSTPQSLTPPCSHSSHKNPDSNSSAHDSLIRSLPPTTPLYVPIAAAPLINQQVLARWPDDGWYYRCVIVSSAADEGRWEVEDASGDTEMIAACDIITDLVDSQRSLLLGDCVAALHPDYTCSYAPGVIASISSDGLVFTVEFYDESQTALPRHEVYRLPKNKHNSDVDFIRRKEADWVGVACVARSNMDGIFYPGKVKSQLPGTRRYVVQWADGSSQEQEAYHMYGQLTRKRALRIGDHVVALADAKVGACMPGVITGTKQGQLVVEFCDGQHDVVDPTHCFWVSQEYHQQAVDFICSHAPPPSEVGGTNTENEELDSDYTLNSVYVASN